MTYIKRAAVILAMLALSATLCACARQNPETAADKTSDAKNTAAAGIEKLVIGSDIYAPYFYISDDGGFDGIDVETAREACKRLGIEPVFKKIDWQIKDECLESGEVDCLWGSFTMNGREDAYTWSGPYLKSRQVVAVQASSGIYSLKELSGKSVAVQEGSKPEEMFLRGLVCGVTETGRVYGFPSLDEVFAALKKDYTDACAGHEAALRELIRGSSGEYRILKEPLLNVKLGVAFLKGTHGAFAEKLSGVLDEMKKDGALAEIVESYGIDSAVMIGE